MIIPANPKSEQGITASWKMCMEGGEQQGGGGGGKGGGGGEEGGGGGGGLGAVTCFQVEY